MKRACLLLLLVLGGVAHAQATASSHADAAAAFYADGNFEGALAEYQAAYDLDPNPDYLYAMAAIEDQRGGCPAAIEYYEKFLATNPPEEDVDAVEDRIKECKRLIGFEAPPEEHPVPEPVPARRPPPPRAVERPWYTDKLGVALTFTGVAALGTGGVFDLLARGAADDAGEPGISRTAFDGRWDRAQRDQLIAGVAAGVGGALVIAGVLHLVLSDRGRVAETIAVGPGDVGLGYARAF